MSDCSRTLFPGGRHRCCLIKVELFHRQAEVCEGASKRPDERTDSSREKLLLFFPSVQDPPRASVPHRHLVSHYSHNSFQWHVSSSGSFFFLAVCCLLMPPIHGYYFFLFPHKAFTLVIPSCFFFSRLSVHFSSVYLIFTIFNLLKNPTFPSYIFLPPIFEGLY